MILPNNTNLENRYLIVRLLGQGGFGAVYEAKDLRLGHRVALKQLILAGPQVLSAFEREARILARLKHPALPRVSDYFASSNSYFLVMEYVEGHDFEALLAERTAPFPVKQVLEWADQLLDGLDYLHSQQPPVIHRDIKPPNIKLSPAGKIYLLDFGISKGGQAYTYQAMSGASIHAFSLHYASMEQIEGQGTDARSDLYSLGVTLHHLLTNQKPPQTISRANAKLMNKPDPLRPVNELNPQVPVKVAEVLASALNFDPDLRPQSARAMRQMLRNAMPQRGAAGAAQAPPTPAKPPIYEPRPRPKPTTPPPLPLLVGLGILLVLVGLVAGSVLFRGTSETLTTANDAPVATATLPEEAEEAPATEIVVAAVATDTPAPTDTPVPANTPVPIPTNRPLPTDTPVPTHTSLPTDTPVPTQVPLPTATPVPPTPELVAGATHVAEKDGMVQVYVPAGDFEMGSADDDPDGQYGEKPRHTVLLSAFWIDRTEVTTAQYAQCVADGACEPPISTLYSRGSSYYGLEIFNTFPVIRVSWHDATAYCEWAGRRLPTEAQWEKAAGGTDGRKWPWGNEPPDDTRANFGPNRDYTTTPVGYYPAGASPYGAYDMAGNVQEWVFDEDSSKYYASSPRENPTGPSHFGRKVLRGGSFLDTALDTRVRYRHSAIDSLPSVDFGFRCARSP